MRAVRERPRVAAATVLGAVALVLCGAALGAPYSPAAGRRSRRRRRYAWLRPSKRRENRLDYWMRGALKLLRRAQRSRVRRDAHASWRARTRGCSTSFDRPGEVLRASAGVAALAADQRDKETRCSSGFSARWWSPTQSTGACADGSMVGLPYRKGRRPRPWTEARTSRRNAYGSVPLGGTGIDEHLSAPRASHSGAMTGDRILAKLGRAAPLPSGESRSAARATGVRLGGRAGTG
jgi:hypothetical protein